MGKETALCPGPPYCVCACHFEAPWRDWVGERLRARLLANADWLACKAALRARDQLERARLRTDRPRR